MLKKIPRVLLKLSGESLGQGGEGVCAKTVNRLAKSLAVVSQKGVALAIVVGGGNIWRFRDNQKLTSLPREKSDYLGMLATVFNGVILAAELKNLGVRVEVFSAVTAPSSIVKSYSIPAAKKILSVGGVVLLTGGTGRPYVTTDTAAAMRADDLRCERVLKATNVDGVYSADPRKNKKAKLFKNLSYEEVIKKKLGVMDKKAFQLLVKKRIPLTVFNFGKKGLLLKAAQGKNVGTVIS